MANKIEPIGIVYHALSEYVHRDGLKYYKRWNAETYSYDGKPLNEYPEWIRFNEWLPLIRLGIHGYIHNEWIDGNVEIPYKASHAGTSEWNGVKYLNGHYLGIEFVVEGKNHYGEFIRKIETENIWSDTHYIIGVDKTIELMNEYKTIKFDNLVTHEMVSGDHVRGIGKGKKDPGKMFNFEMFKQLIKDKLED